MAAKAKKGKTVDKWRKKKYFTILAPKVFQERELGQALAYEPASMEGRSVTTNLMVLTGNMKKQDINVTFKVDRVKGDTAFTRVDKYEVAPAGLKRKVRRQKDRIDESFQCVTKDNKLVRLKPMILTAIKTSRLVRSALRKHVTQFLRVYVRKVDYDSLVMDVVNEKLQREILGRCKKIVPTRFVIIRVLKYVGEQKPSAKPLAGSVGETSAPEKPVKKEEGKAAEPKSEAPAAEA